MDELLDYHDLVANGHDPVPRAKEDPQRDSKLAKFIKSFLSINDGIVSPCLSSEGFYKGLSNHLERQGKLKSAKIVSSGSAEAFNAIRDAWRMFHQENPRIIKPLPPDPSKKPEPKAPVEVKRRKQELMGFDSKSIMRRMALDGYKWFQILRVMLHFKIDATEKMVKAQIWRSKQKGKYGLPARLSKKHLELIDKTVKETRPKRNKTKKKHSSQK